MRFWKLLVWCYNCGCGCAIGVGLVVVWVWLFGLFVILLRCGFDWFLVFGSGFTCCGSGFLVVWVGALQLVRLGLWWFD